MKYYELLKTLRTNNGLTQKELALRAGVSTMTINNWESGRKSPSAYALIKLSKIFNVPIQDILCADQPLESIGLSAPEFGLILKYRKLDRYSRRIVESLIDMELERSKDQKLQQLRSHKVHSVPYKYIPRFRSPAAAGVSAPIECEDYEMIPVNEEVPRGADFAVIIQGNSMSPKINDGDVVYVSKTNTILNGDIGIFNVDGSMYCKQYVVMPDRSICLSSLNPDYVHTNIHISNESLQSVNCFGKVIGV